MAEPCKNCPHNVISFASGEIKHQLRRLNFFTGENHGCAGIIDGKFCGCKNPSPTISGTEAVDYAGFAEGR